MINWKIRFKSKVFWCTAIPAVLLLVKQVMAIFGVEIDINVLSDQLLDIVGTVFLILTLLGIVVDPTTDGIKDSELAMLYGHEAEHEELSTMGRGEMDEQQ